MFLGNLVFKYLISSREWTGFELYFSFKIGINKSFQKIFKLSSSLITKFNFLGVSYQVVCQDVKFVELLIRIMGPFYKFYYGTGFEIIKFLGLEIIWLRLFSFFLYLIEQASAKNFLTLLTFK